jgi:integrase
MARHPEGWKLRKPEGRETYSVYFTVGGKRVERSTGASDQIEAARSAERIYADHVQRNPKPVRIVRRGDAPPLEDLISTWLATDATLDADTAEVWETYGRHWLDHWETLADVTDVTATDYRDKRLRKVQGTTVRKELGALRRFLAWCGDRGYLPRTVNVPGVPTKTTGTRHTQRRRVAAPELAPDECEAFLAALPEWSESRRVDRFAIRARFRVQYETGLRPSTIDGLSVPEHYSRGATSLRITPEIDKMRSAREVPLTDAARKALDATIDGMPARPDGEAFCGLIFGAHEYREHVAAAAKKGLPPAAARVFTGAHLRSARLTHLLERTGNVAGVQHLAGHADTRSTSRYLRPTFRAAVAALESFRGHSPNSVDAPGKRSKKKPSKSSANPRASVRAKERT